MSMANFRPKSDNPGDTAPRPRLLGLLRILYFDCLVRLLSS